MIYKVCRDNSRFYIRKIDDKHYLYSADCGCQIACIAGATSVVKQDDLQCSNVTGILLPLNYYIPIILKPYNIPINSNAIAPTIPGAMDQLCSEISPTYLNISNQIIVTINNPIFSGIYVFEKTGPQPTGYIQGDWVVNTGLTKHSLNPYYHKDHPEFDGKILVALYEGQTNNSISGLYYDGYLEAKTTTADLAYYKADDETDFTIGWEDGSSEAKILEDVYAFPAYYTFTAIQPPCPCSGSLLHSGDFILSQPSGFRFSTGISLPIRYRPPHGDWILIDNPTIPHIITGVPNYKTGASFNNGCSYTDLYDNTIYPNNSYSIQYCSGFPYDSVSFDIDACTVNSVSGAYAKCTGVPDAGFAFISYSSGLPVYESGRNHDRFIGTNISGILGIGNMQWYDRYPSYISGVGKFYCDVNQDPNLATPSLDDKIYYKAIDTRPLFDNKQNSSATWRFTYSCRPLYGCDFPINYGDYTIDSGLKYQCNFNPNLNGSGFVYNPSDKINIELLCPDTFNPSSGLFSQVDDIKVIYKGNTTTIANELICLGLKNNTSSSLWDIYVPTGSNQLINIPYTGDVNYTSLKNWINTELSSFTYNKNTETITDYLPSFDLYYQITGINNNYCTVKILPNDEYKPVSILVSGAGSSSANGVYYFNEVNGAFEQQLTDYIWSIKIIERDELFNWEIGYFDFLDYSDYLYSCSGWKPFYRYSGGWPIDNDIINLPTGTDWNTSNGCFLGQLPAPTTIKY